MKILPLALIFCLSIHQTFAQTTYYSRGAGGEWGYTTSWTLSSDGSGPSVTTVPQRNDHVVILNGSSIEIDTDNENGSGGVSLRSLGYSGFPGDRVIHFYHTGNVTIQNGGTLFSDRLGVIFSGDVLINEGGTLNVDGDLVNEGQIIAQENSTLGITDDTILVGSSETIINNTLSGSDDIYLVEQQALVCGTGSASIGDVIQEFDGADADSQICDTFTINCTTDCGMGTGNTFEGSGNMTLPVELLTFEGYTTGNSIQLDWTTAMEENFDFFTVERAGDNRKFEAIGTLQGQGNSTEEVDYSFTDDAPLPGQALYRLKATDIDGTVEYHRIILVYFDGKGLSDVNVYPNPVSQNNFVVKTQQADVESIQLMDMAGRSMLSQAAKSGENQVSLPQDIRPGAYLLILRTSSGQQHQQRIMVL